MVLRRFLPPTPVVQKLHTCSGCSPGAAPEAIRQIHVGTTSTLPLLPHWASARKVSTFGLPATTSIPLQRLEHVFPKMTQVNGDSGLQDVQQPWSVVDGKLDKRLLQGIAGMGFQ